MIFIGVGVVRNRPKWTCVCVGGLQGSQRCPAGVGVREAMGTQYADFCDVSHIPLPIKPLPTCPFSGNGSPSMELKVQTPHTGPKAYLTTLPEDTRRERVAELHRVATRSDHLTGYPAGGKNVCRSYQNSDASGWTLAKAKSLRNKTEPFPAGLEGHPRCSLRSSNNTTFSCPVMENQPR